MNGTSSTTTAHQHDAPISITWRTEITLTADHRGMLSRGAVADVARSFDGPVSNQITITVRGPVHLVMPDALLELGHLLHGADDITVNAHGTDIEGLTREIHSSRRQHQAFLDEMAEFKARPKPASWE